MDIEAIVTFIGAIVLIVTGIGAFKKDKSTADNLIIDSAVDLIKELRQTAIEKDKIIIDLRAELLVVKNELEICRGTKQRPQTYRGL